MSNPNSTASVIGRLANDPRVFENKDGSKKVMLTVFVDRSYTDAQGNRISDALPFETFVRAQATGIGPFAHVHKGDLVALSYEPRMNRYTKNGVEVFEVKLEIQNISSLESRATTQARLAKRVTKAEAQNQSLQAQIAPVAAAAPAVAHASAVQDEQLPFQTA
ncbi:single-stranded DNA-binding protein [Streptomyces sp. HNM0663]|uniref:Single-stranded DNA-binding protein n=1 Tax=Streptomyces chengmaiensis TaxID=3040919 RepID=A0ABT6HMX9_9ACTN|nr:single-stranded DNA-binding protein [Streptomyces chengmaiensis]MDH2390073.1 single-stranded DNA-binding protein [Streptomyces chengmaiensis]